MFFRKYKKLQDALPFIHALGLKNRQDWLKWANSDQRPADIPLKPLIIYYPQLKGWNEWLGVENADKPKTLPHEQARLLVLPLNIKTRSDWQEYIREHDLPPGVPMWPYGAYKRKGWVSWNYWLKKSKSRFLSYQDAKLYVIPLKLRSRRAFAKWASSGQRPEYIPCEPFTIYRDDGWLGWKDFLGKNRAYYRIHNLYVDYEIAHKYVLTLGLQNHKEWARWNKTGERPKYIPYRPQDVYNGIGWAGWAIWLGTNHICKYKIVYLPYEEARTFAQSLHLATSKEWERFASTHDRPYNIPFCPQDIYKGKGWIDWYDWLGKSRGGRKRKKRKYTKRTIIES